MTLIGDEAVKQVRPIPDIEIDEHDEQLIKMAMIGAFLTTYNLARGTMETLNLAAASLDDIENAREAVAKVIEFNSSIGRWAVDPGRQIGKALQRRFG